MSKIRLHGTSSGYVEIAPAAAASNNTLTAPSTVGEIIAKDAAGAIGITSMKASNVNVGAAVTITESGIEASGIGITCANINGAQIGGRRNLVINGAMMVAQRGTSSTTSGYETIDRQNAYSSGTDETPTQAQVDISSGTGPYNEGFRKALKFTNGNQTSGAQAGSRVLPQYKFEAQDLVNSGWNYISSSSFITISFWVKSSVAQTYYGYFRTQDGTSRIYTYSVALSADTWTKVVKTIPGNSNIQLDNDNGEGIQWNILIPFAGTSYTDSSVSLNTWNTYASGTRTPDNTSTWYTTNDATMEFTGLQAEVGAQATAFEHRSFGDELLRCQRYYQVLIDGDNTTDSFGNATCYNSSSMHFCHQLQPEMRTVPTLDYTTGSNYYNAFQNNTNDTFDTWQLVGNSNKRTADLMASSGVSVMSGASALLRINNASAKIRFTAEL